MHIEAFERHIENVSPPKLKSYGGYKVKKEKEVVQFCVFHLVDVEYARAFPSDIIESVTLKSEGNVLHLKGGGDFQIQDNDQQIAESIGISKPARTLLELTPVKEEHGKSALLTPEAISYIQFLEKETIVGMPDGNNQFHVKETKSQLEPVLAQHGIFIRVVSSYQESEEGA